ncbi:hypothetical protein HDU76_001491 [Blyttiomyces sp. JEL0837]|nr:hypothetical protein HDU76_001491 [Blyttiomyces sp. JEL0837]
MGPKRAPPKPPPKGQKTISSFFLPNTGAPSSSQTSTASPPVKTQSKIDSFMTTPKAKPAETPSVAPSSASSAFSPTPTAAAAVPDTAPLFDEDNDDAESVGFAVLIDPMVGTSSDYSSEEEDLPKCDVEKDAHGFEQEKTQVGKKITPAMPSDSDASTTPTAELSTDKENIEEAKRSKKDDKPQFAKPAPVSPAFSPLHDFDDDDDDEVLNGAKFLTAGKSTVMATPASSKVAAETPKTATRHSTRAKKPTSYSLAKLSKQSIIPTSVTSASSALASIMQPKKKAKTDFASRIAADRQKKEETHDRMKQLMDSMENDEVDPCKGDAVKAINAMTEDDEQNELLGSLVRESLSNGAAVKKVVVMFTKKDNMTQPMFDYPEEGGDEFTRMIYQAMKGSDGLQPFMVSNVFSDALLTGWNMPNVIPKGLFLQACFTSATEECVAASEVLKMILKLKLKDKCTPFYVVSFSTFTSALETFGFDPRLWNDPSASIQNFLVSLNKASDDRNYLAAHESFRVLNFGLCIELFAFFLIYRHSGYSSNEIFKTMTLLIKISMDGRLIRLLGNQIGDVVAILARWAIESEAHSYSASQSGLAKTSSFMLTDNFKRMADELVTFVGDDPVYQEMLLLSPSSALVGSGIVLFELKRYIAGRFVVLGGVEGGFKICDGEEGDLGVKEEEVQEANGAMVVDEEDVEMDVDGELNDGERKRKIPKKVDLQKIPSLRTSDSQDGHETFFDAMDASPTDLATSAKVESSNNSQDVTGTTAEAGASVVKDDIESVQDAHQSDGKVVNSAGRVVDLKNLLAVVKEYRVPPASTDFTRLASRMRTVSVAIGGVDAVREQVGEAEAMKIALKALHGKINDLKLALERTRAKHQIHMLSTWLQLSLPFRRNGTQSTLNFGKK